MAFKLFNVVKAWDIYIAAESAEEALKAASVHIRQEGLRVSEETAIEVRDERNVRAAWREEKPLVADDVSDVDFETVKGKTTLEVFNMLHKRDVKAATK